MIQSHRDRLISSLPADMQARVLKSLQEYSSDGNDAVEACFAAVIETNQRDVAQLREDVRSFLDQLAQSEAREKQLVAAVHTENLKAVREEIRALSDKPLWRRMIASRLVGATIWCVVVYGLTNFYIERKVRTVDPEFHAMLEKLGEKSKIQQMKLDMVMQNQTKTVDFIEKVHKSASTIATDTIVGQTMTRYITAIDKHTITLVIPDARNGNGVQVLSVAHKMSEEEYQKFQMAYMITKVIK
jgi:hypothetical protein